MFLVQLLPGAQLQNGRTGSRSELFFCKRLLWKENLKPAKIEYSQLLEYFQLVEVHSLVTCNEGRVVMSGSCVVINILATTSLFSTTNIYGKQRSALTIVF